MAKIIAGNWKMNGTREQAGSLVSQLITSTGTHPAAQVILFPPAPLLMEVAPRLAGTVYQLGAQDISPEERGAFTGDCSAEMLLSVGCSHVLVGHSERRQFHTETDDLVGRKVCRALQSGLTPILCIGELLPERETGETRNRLETQLNGSFAQLSQLPKGTLGSIIVAYEPVWAIGTGKVATPEIASEAHSWISSWLGARGLKLSILYGGSVTASNAASLLSAPHVDGVLVGGASLKPTDFAAIIAAGS